MRQLVHYTETVGTIVSILENGFLLIPNRRDLLHELVDKAVSWDREPQECGMVSFTELPLEGSYPHRQRFGGFGIGVTWEWAERYGVERVLYVRREGPMFEAFRFMFTSAYRDVLRRESEGPLSWGGLSIHNRAMAETIGAAGWASMLRLYEFMQPDQDSAQVEWRIINALPFTFSSREKEKQIEQALQLSRTWETANLRVSPADIVFISCPGDSRAEMIKQLPVQFRGVRVVEADSRD